ncbi:MAG: prolipoprotein diacylglyceryl transferase [bacterium]|nr:prolipoprotein diacylglyceryl transferase [bacterium]
MYPVLFSFGTITVYTFGVFAFGAFLISVFLFWRFCREDVSEEDTFDLAIITALSGFTGARIFYLVLHWQDFWPHIDKLILFIRYPGFSLYGGIIAGGATFAVAAFLKKLNARRLADFAAVSILPALAVGRVGEFLSGGGFGLKTDIFLKTKTLWFFENRHPIQLYLTICFLLLFVFTAKFWPRFCLDNENCPKKEKDGLLFLFTLFSYGLFNFVFSFYQEGKDIFTIRLFSALSSLSGLTITIFWFKNEIGEFVVYLLVKIKGGQMFKKIISFPMVAIKAIASTLERQRQETEKRIMALKKEDPYEDTSRLVDNASDDTEAAEEIGHERTVALKAELEKHLAKIKKALSKIGVGKYGICDKCGKAIDPARLKIFPMADTCVTCEREKE